jgi:outer membrane immunogenic protein
MFKYLSFFTLSAVSFAAPALAQDQAPEDTPFSGFRLEAITGYARTDVEAEGSGGIVYGGAAGFDVQSGSIVFGLEVEGSDSTIDKCVGGIFVPGDTLCVQEGRDLYAGGRIGAVVGSKTLLYVKAGYTNGRINADYEDGTAGTAADFEAGENLDGIRGGAGAEIRLGGKSYAKIEYRYSNYEQGFDKHQGVIGFGLRF